MHRRSGPRRTAPGREARAHKLVRRLVLTRWRRPVSGRITIVSPDYSGNAAAFGDYLRAHAPHMEVFHLVHRTGAMGPSSAPTGRYSREGIRRLDHRKLRDLVKVARSEVVLTTWGPGTLHRWLRRQHRPLFVEAWHGVGFKARLLDQAQKFQRYDAILASSEYAAQAYRERGMTAVATGYARMDVTMAAAQDPQARALVRDVLADAGLAEEDQPTPPVVLVAPTVTGEGSGARVDTDALLAALDEAAAAHGFVVALRPHPVSPVPDVSRYRRIVPIPVTAVGSTEHLLAGIDVVVTDWSSLATDFLPLGRPVVYLDGPPPAEPMFPLDAQDRPGPVAGSVNEATDAVVAAVRHPQQQLREYRDQRAHTLDKAWGDTLDSEACARYLRTLQEHGVRTEVR